MRKVWKEFKLNNHFHYLSDKEKFKDFSLDPTLMHDEPKVVLHWR